MRPFRSLRTLVLPFLPLLVLGACSDEAPRSPSAGASASTLPASLWATQAPPDALEVGATRAAATAGTRVAVRGRVKDFVADYAAFTLIDLALTPCNALEGDECETPWDYCCEDAEVKVRHTVTVEVRGGTGKPLRAPLRGVHGVDHLVPVVVEGEVAKDTAGNVTILAERLYVARGE